MGFSFGKSVVKLKYEKITIYMFIMKLWRGINLFYLYKAFD